MMIIIKIVYTNLFTNKLKTDASRYSEFISDFVIPMLKIL